MGHQITKDGICADSCKVTAIREMPSPTDIQGVKRFYGMVQYLARFMPNLAQSLEPLRRLTKNVVVWDWNSDFENALNMK